MNDSYAIGVDIGATELTIAPVNNQREVSEVFLISTLPQKDPAANIEDIACGINSHRNQDGSGERSNLDSFIMTSSEALEAEKEISLPRNYQELQVLPSKQLSSAFGLTNLVLYFEKENCIN